MAQLFSNNADTQLSAPLSDVGVSASLADAARFSTPTGGDYELLTLIAGADVEIVRMTARSGNTITITRAQEGTTAIAWGTGARIFSPGVTAGTLAATLSNQSSAANALAIGSASAAEAGGTALGKGTYAGDATKTGATAVGIDAYCEGTDTTALGSYAYAADANFATALGSSTTASGAFSLAAGPVASAHQAEAVAVGAYTEANLEAVAIGSYANASGQGSVAIGNYAAAAAPNIATLGALLTVPAGAPSAATAAWKKSSAGTVILSAAVSLKTAQTITIALPSGVLFFPDEVGVIVATASGVTGQPTVRFGITGDETRYLAATATVGLDAVAARHRFTTLASAAGASTLRAEVTVAATGTTLTGHVYWRGFAVES